LRHPSDALCGTDPVNAVAYKNNTDAYIALLDYPTLEAKYFYLLEWADDVVDIREQFPLLPVSDTELIADEFGFKHTVSCHKIEYSYDD